MSSGDVVTDTEEMLSLLDEQVRELYDRWQTLKARAQATPDDEDAEREAERARESYESVRDHRDRVQTRMEEDDDG